MDIFHPATIYVVATHILTLYVGAILGMKLAKATMNRRRGWRKIKHGPPTYGLRIYMWNGERLIRGYYGKYYCPNTNRGIVGYAEYNAGELGQSLPVHDVTHWAYEEVPTWPRPEKDN